MCVTSSQCRVCACVAILLLTLALTADSSNSIDVRQTNKIEFKTKDTNQVYTKTYKDCHEYLHGHLSAVRHHGSTWQNDAADCSNCMCDNGDIRCFFHFCNGPPVDFMTPPTTDKVTDEEDGDYEASGFPPSDDDLATDEGDAQWPEDVVPKPWRDEFDASLGLGKSKDTDENETHQEKSQFCGKTCKKECPNGFERDAASGCMKCACLPCPPRDLKACKSQCSFGFRVDASGCAICKCRASPDDDIVFTDENVYVKSDDHNDAPHSDFNDEDSLKETNLLPKVAHPRNNGDVRPATVHGGEEEPCNTTHDEDVSFAKGPPLSPVFDGDNSSLMPMEGIGQDLEIDEELEGDSFITSIPTGGKSSYLLLLVLIPMCAVFCVAVVVSAHLWRRYHRDKYDINGFRSEEKQKLRPVKTPSEDGSVITLPVDNLC